MQKKCYSTPEVDIEKFTIYCDLTNSGLVDGDNWGTDNGEGGDDF